MKTLIWCRLSERQLARKDFPVQLMNECSISDDEIVWSVDLGKSDPEVWQHEATKCYFRDLISSHPALFAYSCSNVNAPWGNGAPMYLFWVCVGWSLFDGYDAQIAEARRVFNGLLEDSLNG